MSDQEARGRLARLIVDALEVGTGKNEQDVIGDLFDSFGLDFATLDRQFPRHRFPQQRTTLLREAAAEQLAGAAPTTAVLLNGVVRLGGRFVSMVEEIYQRLARHTATTTGTSEAFRLRRSDVDESPLTISPAFLEQVRRLTSTLTRIEIGRIDVTAVQSFLRWDVGRLHGNWPPRDASGNRLADHILALGWIAPAVADQDTSSAMWAEATDAVITATRAAERVIGTAEWLVRSYLTSLDAFSDENGVIRSADVFTYESSHWITNQMERQFKNEVSRYHNSETLAVLAFPSHVNGIDEPTFLGLDRQLGPVHVPGSDSGGTGMGMLAGFVAQWRDGHWSLQSRAELEPKLFGDPQHLTQWLDTLTSQCNDAAEWLATEVLHPTMPLDVTTLLESVEEFLNLPLWRQRDLLYEIWVLCATLDACEHAGWRVHLAGTADTDGVWELPNKATDKPVGQLQRQSPSPTYLDVWREPNRTPVTGDVTPDVTVATPAPYARELIVVEAKDRRRMRVHKALSDAERYAAALCPAVTWVVNHCDYRRDTDPLEEHGTVWSRIRLAAQFRPGNVPAAFTDTIRTAVTPPDDQASGADQT
ncbi:hypothetical protein [Actinoallomurus sp. NPDC052274]|uniref:hypothetical protein n=1 Tax=Actinoallomurus sp. NPDC052274 TaxID=3155420 RepID=UPI0034398E4E